MTRVGHLENPVRQRIRRRCEHHRRRTLDRPLGRAVRLGRCPARRAPPGADRLTDPLLQPLQDRDALVNLRQHPLEAGGSRFDLLPAQPGHLAGLIDQALKALLALDRLRQRGQPSPRVRCRLMSLRRSRPLALPRRVRPDPQHDHAQQREDNLRMGQERARVAQSSKLCVVLRRQGVLSLAQRPRPAPRAADRPSGSR